MNLYRRVINWINYRRDRAALRRALLAMPGVDDLIVRAMDKRYGAHNWDVVSSFDSAEPMLVAKVRGPAGEYWGPIGPLTAERTRGWCTLVLSGGI